MLKVKKHILRRSFNFNLLTALLLTATPQAIAEQLDIISEELKSYDHGVEGGRCESSHTCTLESYNLKKQDYKLLMDGGEYFGTRVFANYTTKEINQLEEYAFVQHMRGCMFESKVENGEVKKINYFTRKMFAESVPFHFTNWVVDSFDRDPMYNSYDIHELSKINRHMIYKINENDRDKLYGWYKPLVPTLHISDRPGVAFYDKKSKEAINVSLAFKLCIFKTSDIPRVANSDDLNFAEPIKCFNWDSSIIFNHKKEKFEFKEEIDEFCQKPLE